SADGLPDSRELFWHARAAIGVESLSGPLRFGNGNVRPHPALYLERKVLLDTAHRSHIRIWPVCESQSLRGLYGNAGAVARGADSYAGRKDRASRVIRIRSDSDGTRDCSVALAWRND